MIKILIALVVTASLIGASTQEEPGESLWAEGINGAKSTKTKVFKDIPTSGKAGKMFKVDPTTCSAESLSGIYRYMATSGGAAGKGFTVIISYDPRTENDAGVFTLFADGMSNGFPGSDSNFDTDGTLIVDPDDSAFVPFDDTAFLINEDGLCELRVPGNPFALCPLQGTSKPDCSFVMTAVQLSTKTIQFHLQGDGFEIDRIAIRN